MNTDTATTALTHGTLVRNTKNGKVYTVWGSPYMGGRGLAVQIKGKGYNGVVLVSLLEVVSE